MAAGLIAHNAIVHGCIIEDNVLIGMGAIVMDNCIVKSNSIIAAEQSLLKNTVVESGVIYAGMDVNRNMTYPDREILDAATQEYKIDNQFRLTRAGIQCNHLEGIFPNILWRKNFLTVTDTAGIVADPRVGFRIGENLSVNYILTARASE